jgi:hypothetical protein
MEKISVLQRKIHGFQFSFSLIDRELIKSRGIDAIINDDLISNVLNLGGFAVGMITATSGYAYVYFSILPKTSLYYTSVCILAFCVGFAEFSIL